MNSRARSQKWSVLSQMLLFATFLCSQSFAEVDKQGEPFTSFRSLDAKLSLLDAQFGQLQGEIEQVGKLRDGKRRGQAYKRLHNSKNSRQIRSTVTSISATARTLASRHVMRRSRYGRLIVRSLSRRATAMKRDLHYLMLARTNKQAHLSLRKFSDAMLGFVLQFQAVSGGYGALQCEPGSWTCCGRKKVRASGGTALNGCAWQCVKGHAACRSGCLGPRTPVAARRPALIQERKLTAAPRPRSPWKGSPSSTK